MFVQEIRNLVEETETLKRQKVSGQKCLKFADRNHCKEKLVQTKSDFVLALQINSSLFCLTVGKLAKYSVANYREHELEGDFPLA